MNQQGTPGASQESPPEGQKRAQKGGETGPNGEWYPAGSFIATKDLPKRTKEWLERRSWDRPVAVELATRTTGAKLAAREVGMGAIAEAITDVLAYGESINETYLAYLRSRGHGAYADHLLEWLRLYRDGVRHLSIYEHPSIARVEDIVLLARSGRPIPDTLLEMFAPQIRKHVQAIVQARSR